MHALQDYIRQGFVSHCQHTIRNKDAISSTEFLFCISLPSDCEGCLLNGAICEIMNCAEWVLEIY